MHLFTRVTGDLLEIECKVVKYVGKNKFDLIIPELIATLLQFFGTLFAGNCLMFCEQFI